VSITIKKDGGSGGYRCVCVCVCVCIYILLGQVSGAGAARKSHGARERATITVLDDAAHSFRSLEFFFLVFLSCHGRIIYMYIYIYIYLLIYCFPAHIPRRLCEHIVYYPYGYILSIILY